MGQIRVILKSNLLLESTSVTWFMEQGLTLSLSTVMLLFRKPPDEWIAFNEFVVQVRKRRSWFARFLLTILLLFIHQFVHCNASPVSPTTEFNEDPYVENHPVHDVCAAAMIAEQLGESSPRDIG